MPWLVPLYINFDATTLSHYLKDVSWYLNTNAFTAVKKSENCPSARVRVRTCDRSCVLHNTIDSRVHVHRREEVVSEWYSKTEEHIGRWKGSVGEAVRGWRDSFRLTHVSNVAIDQWRDHANVHGRHKWHLVRRLACFLRKTRVKRFKGSITWGRTRTSSIQLPELFVSWGILPKILSGDKNNNFVVEQEIFRTNRKYVTGYCVGY